MRDLMTNAVAGRMNFIGHGGKTAIRNMRLLKVLIGKKIFDVHDLHVVAYMPSQYDYMLCSPLRSLPMA